MSMLPEKICILPWISVETSPIGTARPCCLAIDKIVKPGWWEAAKHPDKEDHEEIAKIILKEYNL